MTPSWLRCRAPRPAARVRLVCFPHAGGSAGFFGSWATALAGEIEMHAVQYPGREVRILEPCLDDMDQMAGGIALALGPLLDRPLALFGHSMGAAVAYEVARMLERARGVTLAHLFVSGRHAPAELVLDDIHLRDDDGLVAELTRLGGTDSALLSNPELRGVLLPAIRSDFRLAETYRHRPGAPLSCPITALVGDRDTEVTLDQARRWREHSTGPFTLGPLPGGHFYLLDQEAELIALLARALARREPAPPSPDAHLPGGS